MIRNSPSKRVFVVAFVAIGVFVFVAFQSTNQDSKGTDNRNESSGLEARSEKNLTSTASENNKIKSYEDLLSQVNATLGSADVSNLYDTGSDNLTDALARGATAGLASSFEKGVFDVATQEQIINNLADQLPQRVSTIYTLDDLTITQKNDDDTLRTYLVEFITAIVERPDVYDEDPLEIIDQWFITNNRENLRKLDELSSLYAGFTEELLTMAVPENIAGIHLKLTNSIQNIALALDDMSKIESDPIKSMLGAADYSNQRAKKTQAVIELTLYINDHLSVEG
ncbi:hypothetical protein IID27_02425 [Patescibacteria group bacterium]|nr:hypothetical protein [Patescibacteria group bacterium]